MGRQIPESWDRCEAIRFMEELILLEREVNNDMKPFKIRVTSIEVMDNFSSSRETIYVRYRVNMTTSRSQLSTPDEWWVTDYSILESHMIQYMRDEKLKKILDDEV
jgi:hypothetical protein